MCVICSGEYNLDESTEQYSNNGICIIPRLSTLTHLKCSHSTYIVNIPYMSNLIHILFYRCPQLVHVPSLPLLCTIDIAYCHSLSSIDDQPSLNDLRIRNCDKLLWLPGAPDIESLRCNFSSITVIPYTTLTLLFCNYCVNLVSIPICPYLTHLQVEGCCLITTIPYLSRLNYLSCRNCDLLECVPDSDALLMLNCSNIRLPIAPQLNSLDCSNNHYLHDLALFPLLSTFACNNCNNMCNIAHSNVNNLRIKNCDGLLSISNLPNAKSIKVTDCNNLISVSDCAKLCSLDLQYCASIALLHNLPRMTNLTCYKCNSLRVINAFNALTKLYCEDCPALQTIYYVIDADRVVHSITKILTITCCNCSWLTQIVPTRHDLPSSFIYEEPHYDGCPLLYVPASILADAGERVRSAVVLRLRMALRRVRSRRLRAVIKESPLYMLRHIIADYAI